MNVMVPVPEALAARFGSADELGRRAVEGLAVEALRAGRMTAAELGVLLGLGMGGELERFLVEHGVMAAGITTAGLEAASADTEIVARFQAFAANHTLGGIGAAELIRDGRR